MKDRENSGVATYYLIISYFIRKALHFLAIDWLVLMRLSSKNKRISFNRSIRSVKSKNRGTRRNANFPQFT